MKLTDRILASGASLTDLIHIVITGDTSQNPAGSSFKIPMSAYASLFSGSSSSSSGDTYWVSGSTWNGTNYPIKVQNNTGLDATGDYAVAEGYGTLASGLASHAEGYITIASGLGSHAEGGGYFNGLITVTGGTAIGEGSHAEGLATTSLGFGSHSQNAATLASGQTSHAEGYLTTAGGHSAHAEGQNTTAEGHESHAQNKFTWAFGPQSHAGGSGTTALGSSSFVHGYNSVVVGDQSVVLGSNITGTTTNTTFVETLALTTVRDYINDAAADADVTLASGGLYTTSGTTGRIVYRKP